MYTSTPRTLDLVIPAGQSEVTFTPRHNTKIFYSEIRLKEYSISLEGDDGTQPSKLNLQATENIFNQNLCNGLTSPSFSVPIVLHNRQSQNAGEFTTYDFHYPYPFVVGKVCNSRGDVATNLPGNITFTLYSPILADQPGSVNGIPYKRAKVFAESTIVLELLGGDNQYITDPLNSKLNIPSFAH